MGQETAYNDAQSTPDEPTSGLQVTAHRAAQDLSAYDMLLIQYGEVMLRIGQLEAQVSQLTRQLQSRGEQDSYRGGAYSPQQNRGLQDLAEKVEALQNLISESPGQTRQPTPERNTSAGDQISENEIDPHADELQQLRLQMNNLANQLVLTEEQLEEVRGQRSRGRGRRRKREPRPWWKKVARRVGLR